MNFQQAEKKFKQRKAQFEAGELTETELKNHLEDLMVLDERGNWWMIGYETEKWYRNEGAGWVQADPPDMFSQKSTPVPNWIAILWIALGWAVSITLFIGPIFSAISDSGIFILQAISGAIGGLITSIALQSEGVLLQRRGLLWITLGWAISQPIAELVIRVISGIAPELVFGSIFGAIGGLSISIALRKKRVPPYWKGMLWITFGWTLGWAIGMPAGAVFGPSIAGTISGAIGGFITVWQLRNG